jgi:hypothetical protein
MKLDPMNLDLCAIDAQSAINRLRLYLGIIEKGMESTYRSEKAKHEAGAPTTGDEEDRELHWQLGNHIDRLYDEDLKPAMRYSFIVLVHIVFENQLRQFCNEIKKEKKFNLSLPDLSGSPIDRAQTFLSKVAGLSVGGFPEWQNVRSIQKVRDCVVHAYGRLGDLANDKDKKAIRELATKNVGIGVDQYSGKLTIDNAFCEWCLTEVEKLFENLFVTAGWYKSSTHGK